MEAITSTADWKDVEEYPKYLVSKCGLVKRNGKLITPISNNGYLKVTLSKNNKRKQLRVHRLVAKAWLPEPLPGQTQINHIDGNKQNNHVSNLEWCSPSENMAHFRKTHPIMLPRVTLRFTKEDEVKTFPSIQDAAKHFQKAMSTIWGASLHGKWNGYKVERVQVNEGPVGPTGIHSSVVDLTNETILDSEA